MRLTITILTALIAICIGLTSFEKYEVPSNSIPFSFESNEDFIDEESKDELDNAYDAYLEELAIPGPKAEEILPATINDVSSITKTTNEQVAQSSTYEEPKEVVETEIITETKLEELPGSVDHTPFGALLKKHVNSKGNVNYAAFKKDEAALDAYLNQLRSNPVSKDMGKNERLAYWINVYNAFTIKLILENYPLNSIMDLEGGKPWDKVFIKLGNTSYSLNMVENEVIRKRFTEPRIHFAVNCAAASCPPLLNDAFYPDRLTNQLAERTSSFLTNSEYNTITSSKLEVSKIFDWYGADFGDVKNYLKGKTNVEINNQKLEFKEYDWSLNKQ